MDLLLKKGWILSESALKSNETNLKKLLDRDLREIGAGISDLGKGKFETIEHEKIVLQVMKIRNISAPKANENSKTAPKLLKIQLTDGVNSLSAIEMDPTDLSIDTKPGTKIAVKVKQLKMSNGQLLFTPKNIEILGGEVEALVSKWDVTRSLALMKGARSTTTGGPPAFIPFGQKIDQNNAVPNDRGFKSLALAKQKESDKDDSEFKAQRQDAIAEAAAKGTKKMFGGGSKQLVDGNVQKIIDKGYSEEQAVTALKYAHNNVDRALSNLKKREEQQKRGGSNDYEPREKRGSKGDHRDRGHNSAEAGASKPSTNVSLFSFLEDKIPTTENTAKESHYHNERFENNISSSFRKHDKEISNKSQQWSSNEHKSSHNKNYNSYNNPREYRGDRDRGDRDRGDRDREYRDRGDRDREYRDRGDRDRGDRGRVERVGEGPNNQKDSKHQSSYQQERYQGKPSNNFQQNQSNQYQKPSSAPTNHSSTSYSSSNNNTKKYERYDKYEKYEKFDKFEKYPKPSSQSDYSGNKQSSYQQHQPSAQAQPPPQHQQNSNYKSRNNMNNSGKYFNNDHHQGNSSRNNIVDSMDKMSLRGNQTNQAPPAMSNPPPSYPPTAPSNESSKQKPFVKPGSYPIVGFQNKEANEHAKNALKTKIIPGIPQHPLQQQQQQPTNWQKQSHQPPMQPNTVSMSIPQNQPPAPFSNQQPSVVQQQSMPQPFVQSAMIPHPMPVFTQPINYPTQILVSSIPTPQTVSNPHSGSLKIGDLCMAKYWEDGQFYNAKITDVSEATFVVVFTEYGNAEEVRKNDCIPMIPACPTPPHSGNFVPSQPAQAYHVSQPQQKMPHHHHNYQPQQASYNSNMIHAKNHQRR